MAVGGSLTVFVGVYQAADKEAPLGGGPHLRRGEGHGGHLHVQLPVGHHLRTVGLDGWMVGWLDGVWCPGVS